MIVGRTTEQRELDDLLQSAHGGSSGRLLLVGDPGIGITTLLHWLSARAHDRGLDVRAVHGREFRGPEQVAPLASAPTVLLIDDVDQAEPAAVAGLAELLRSTAVPVAAVTARHSHPVGPDPLDGWPRRHVGPLTLDESMLLLKQEYGAALDPGVGLALAAALGGNPLAVLAIAEVLTETQRLGRAPLPDPLPVPSRLNDAWEPIVGPLPAPVHRAALDLVVCGPNTPLLIGLSAHGDWSADDLLALIDAGLAERSPDGSLAYRSPVIGAVVRSRAAPTVLRERHRAAAEVGMQLDCPPSEIVHHLARATALPDEEVAVLVQRQAERAEALDQFLVANDAWQCAARLSTDRTERTARALRSLALIVENGLDYAGTRDLLDLLSGEHLDARRALWVEWLQTLLRADADPDAALGAQWATIERARTAAPQTLRELLLDTAMNAWTLGEPVAGLAAAREYLQAERDAATETVEPPWTGTALLAAGLFQIGEVASSVGLRAQAIAAAATVDPTTMSFDRLLTTVFLDDLLLDTGAPACDRLLLAAQRAEARSSGLACIYGTRAWRYRAAGQWARAHEMLVRGRPMAAQYNATGPQLGMAALTCELAALQGADDLLAHEGMHARAFALRVGDRRRLATVDRAFGLKALVAGRLEEAQVNLSAAADVPFLGRGLRDAVIPSRVDLVEVHLRLDDRSEALRRAAEVSAVLREMDDPLARAFDLRVRALVSDDLDLLRVAVEAHLEASDPFEEGRTRLLLAERLRRGRQRVQARTQLFTAERLFSTLEATPWLERTRAELRASGSERPRSPGLATLTPQEAAVAQAVARGASNKEVAAELFLSPRTVEYHLASAYRKLGVRGRTALTRALAGSGIQQAS